MHTSFVPVLRYKKQMLRYLFSQSISYENKRVEMMTPSFAALIIDYLPLISKLQARFYESLCKNKGNI